MTASSARRVMVLALAPAVGVLAGCGRPPPAVILAAPAFCYRTLAEPECQPTPRPGEGSRLIVAGPKYP